MVLDTNPKSIFKEYSHNTKIDLKIKPIFKTYDYTLYTLTMVKTRKSSKTKRRSDDGSSETLTSSDVESCVDDDMYDDEDYEYDEDEDDEDYEYDEDEDDEDYEYDDQYEEEDEEGIKAYEKLKQMLQLKPGKGGSTVMFIIQSDGLESKNEEVGNEGDTPIYDTMSDRNITSSFSPEEKKYWDALSKKDKTMLKQHHTDIKKKKNSSSMPLKFKILKLNIDPSTKMMLLHKIDQYNMMSPSSSEYFKLGNWLASVSRLPLGVYHRLPIDNLQDTEKCASFLDGVQRSMDERIYGHIDAKNQILRILAQWISNPTSRGHCIGIQGAMGTGKTSLVKDGLCKALNIPFGFIPLGGAADGSFLDGYSFTYEGSVYGKVAEVLMRTQCMNPIIFFDELDKVSESSRGREIIGILTHLTDSTQNERFNDKYFGEIDIDLSKSLIIFSYNDESLINPILKDRMITIHVKGYDQKDKLVLARDYLLPEIIAQYKFNPGDVLFDNETIIQIIQKVPAEQGVRNLKRGIESIVSWINMHRYIPDNEKTIAFPVTVTCEHVRKFVSIDTKNNTYIHSMYT
jgi:ATP-dependent Lon protease